MYKLKLHRMEIISINIVESGELCSLPTLTRKQVKYMYLVRMNRRIVNMAKTCEHCILLVLEEEIQKYLFETTTYFIIFFYLQRVETIYAHGAVLCHITPCVFQVRALAVGFFGTPPLSRFAYTAPARSSVV